MSRQEIRADNEAKATVGNSGKWTALERDEAAPRKGLFGRTSVGSRKPWSRREPSSARPGDCIERRWSWLFHWSTSIMSIGRKGKELTAGLFHCNHFAVPLLSDHVDLRYVTSNTSPCTITPNHGFFRLCTTTTAKETAHAVAFLDTSKL